MKKNYEIYRTTTGLNFSMDSDLYEKVITNDEDGLTYSMLESYIIAEQYFPQLLQVIVNFIFLFKGYTNFWSILLINLLSGIIFTFIWNNSKLYRVPGLALISNLIGQYFFRLFLHIIVIAILSFTYFNDWKILLFCIIAGIITNIIKTLISGYDTIISHNNDIARYTINMIKNNKDFLNKKQKKLNTIENKNFTDDENELIKMVNIFYENIIKKYLSIEKETQKVLKLIDFEDVYLKFEDLLKADDIYAEKMYSLKNDSKLKRTLFIANESLVELLTYEITLNKRLNDKANGLEFTKEDFDILSLQKNKSRDELEQKLEILKKELEIFIQSKN